MKSEQKHLTRQKKIMKAVQVRKELKLQRTNGVGRKSGPCCGVSVMKKTRKKDKQNIWSDLFFERCPNKKHFEACWRHTQAYNIDEIVIKLFMFHLSNYANSYQLKKMYFGA